MAASSPGFQLRRRVGAVCASLLLATTLLTGRSAAAVDAPTARFVTTDVDRFYAVYDAAAGHPSAASLQRDYLDGGSEALHQFATSRALTGASLAKAIESNGAVFREARDCVRLLPRIGIRVESALRRLHALYPPATFPPITIVIGRASTGGTTTATGVIIGLETLCAARYIDPDPEDRFVHLIAHEYVHVQQPAAEGIDDTGGTVLLASLVEGGAEFVGSLISGDVAYTELRRRVAGREAGFEDAFVADEDSTVLDRWLYNGRGTDAWPGDLGYRIGARIVQSYYRRAADKARAVDDILHVATDRAHAFVAASGWEPGIALPGPTPPGPTPPGPTPPGPTPPGPTPPGPTPSSQEPP